MAASLIWIAGSAGALFVLVTLFHVESHAGHRIILGAVRRYADRAVLWLQARGHAVSLHLGTGSMRIVLHYGCNAILIVLRNLLHRGEAYLTALVRRNRRAARSIAAEKTDTHLSAMAEHKKATELTEREKVKLRREMLEG